MADELLSDILAVERDIRLQVEAMERQTAEHLAALRVELARMLEAEAAMLREEQAQAVARAEQAALHEADALLNEAGAFARRLERMDDVELERVFLQQSGRILPEGADDRQDEQT